MHWWKRLIVPVCTAVFLFSSYKVAATYEGKVQNDKLYEQVRQEFASPAPQTNQSERGEPRQQPPLPKAPLPAGTEDAPETAVKPAAEPAAKPEVLPVYKKLLAQNKDTVGWIRVPGTPIDYPVVQTKDNSYYIHHNFKRKRSAWGAIFMDYRNAPDGDNRNTILYGHHMKDGSMFKGLTQYRKESFFNKNMMISFSTKYEEIEYEVFSVYVAEADEPYLQTSFRSGRDYTDFLVQLQQKSLFSRGLAFSKNDKILTLSTCSYEYENARLVVHARRIP
ncbi:class B sortase [Paenibacillus gansuensis]|uniref:Class B sortase n=1 Tax=Paenibacillus gansuensis TaxID=306542 RepID=A0ABW5P7V8_9BACL